MRARVLAAAALAAAVLAGRAAAAPPAAGTVTFLAGTATRAAGGKVETLAVGTAVYQGDVLETQRRTRLEVKLQDESVLRLGPASRLALDAAVFGRTPEDRRVSARLRVGDVWASVAKAVGGEGRFEVKTENAVAGVRGTTFRVDARQDRSCVVKVYAGTVAVAAGELPRPDHRDDAKGTAPAAGPDQKPARKQVEGPAEVSREQWEKIVTSMMQVRVSADGSPGEPEPFALAGAGKDEWEAWNRERDAAR